MKATISPLAVRPPLPHDSVPARSCASFESPRGEHFLGNNTKYKNSPRILTTFYNPGVTHFLLVLLSLSSACLLDGSLAPLRLVRIGPANLLGDTMLASCPYTHEVCFLRSMSRYIGARRIGCGGVVCGHRSHGCAGFVPTVVLQGFFNDVWTPPRALCFGSPIDYVPFSRYATLCG